MRTAREVRKEGRMSVRKWRNKGRIGKEGEGRGYADCFRVKEIERGDKKRGEKESRNKQRRKGSGDKREKREGGEAGNGER